MIKNKFIYIGLPFDFDSSFLTEELLNQEDNTTTANNNDFDLLSDFDSNENITLESKCQLPQELGNGNLESKKIF